MANNSWLSRSLRNINNPNEPVDPYKDRRESFNQAMNVQPMGSSMPVSPQMALRNEFAYGSRGGVDSQNDAARDELMNVRAQRLAEERFQETRPGGRGILGGIAYYMGGRNKDEKIADLKDQYLTEERLTQSLQGPEMAKGESQTYERADGSTFTVIEDDYGRAYDPTTFEPVAIGDAVPYSKTAQTNIYTGNAPGDEFYSGFYGSQQGVFDEAKQRANTAFKNAQDLQRFLQVSPSGGQGLLQPFISQIKNLGATFGMEMGGLTEETLMDMSHNSIMTEFMRELGARGLTEGENQRLMAALPQASQSREAREEIANILFAQQVRDIQKYDAYEDQMRARFEADNQQYFNLNSPQIEEWREILPQAIEEGMSPEQALELIILRGMNRRGELTR